MQLEVSFRCGMSARLIFICFCMTYGASDELGLIRQLNDYFEFDHNIFLFDASTDLDRFIETTGSFTPQSLYIFKSADNGSIPELESLKNIWSKNTFVIVVPASVNFERTLNLLTRVKEIQTLQIDMKIGIFFQHVASSDDLQRLFRWSWAQRIINIFAATPSEDWNAKQCSIHVFTFNPFGTFNVINVTGSESYDNYFLRQDSNFQNFSIELDDELYAKIAVDEKFWLAAFGVMNASSLVTPYNYNDSHGLKIYTSLFVMYPAEENYFYPMDVEKTVIIVPEALPFPDFSAYLRAIASSALLGYSFATFAVIIIFLCFFRFKKQKKFSFFESVADVANLLMNDNGYIKYQKLSAVEAWIIVPLTFIGFIFVNGIFLAFQSHLTSPIYQPQINTIDELYNSPLINYAWYEYVAEQTVDRLNNLLAGSDWSDKVLVTPKNQPIKDTMLHFNRSIFYIDTQNFVGMLLQVQKRLNIKGYHITSIDYSTQMPVYLSVPEFPFKERVNQIIHRILDSGLFKLWRKQEMAAMERSFLDLNRNRNQFSDNRNLENFEMPMIIVYGWIASTVVFVVEIIWHKFMLRRVVETRKRFSKMSKV